MRALTYKYRIKDRRARKYLRQHATALNQVWNYCVAVERDIERRYKAGGRRHSSPTHFSLNRKVAGTSKALGVHSGSIQSMCWWFVRGRDQNRTTPKFRASHGSRRALGFIPFGPGDRQVNGNTITYLGRKYRFWEGRRPLPMSAKGGCFVEDSLGRWWVCFTVPVSLRNQYGQGAIGIDLGLKTLAALSNGTKIDAPSYYRHWEQRLATAQRAGNKRRAKAIHAKIANCRRDHMHKTTTQIARTNKLIVVGLVNAAALKKTMMSKSVQDVGWYKFRRALEYKASMHQATYLEVNERGTSVTCSSCGARSGPKGHIGLRVRQWDCSQCGARHDRDVNSAKRILHVGLSAQPPVEENWLLTRMREGCLLGSYRESTRC